MTTQTNLTKKELQLLKDIASSEYCSLDLDDIRLINYPVWMFSVKDNYSGKVFSGLCSSLTEKGFIDTDTVGDKTMKHVPLKDTYTICMTEAGFNALQASLADMADDGPARPLKLSGTMIEVPMVTEETTPEEEAVIIQDVKEQMEEAKEIESDTYTTKNGHAFVPSQAIRSNHIGSFTLLDEVTVIIFTQAFYMINKDHPVNQKLIESINEVRTKFAKTEYQVISVRTATPPTALERQINELKGIYMTLNYTQRHTRLVDFIGRMTDGDDGEKEMIRDFATWMTARLFTTVITGK